jgi:hypothetical protein
VAGIEQPVDDVGPDEPRAAGDEDSQGTKRVSACAARVGMSVLS